MADIIYHLVNRSSSGIKVISVLVSLRLVRVWPVKASPEWAARSQLAEGAPAARAMLLLAVLSCALAAAAAPASYDERQDGDLNVRADVKNVLLLVAVPKMNQLLSPNLFNFMLTKSAGGEPVQPGELQERADVRVMEAFVEPSTPYHVEIGVEGERSAGGDARGVEVVIAGRRRAASEEPEPEAAEAAEAADADEITLLGATEQCGPERERDPVTLMCRARATPRAPPTPSSEDTRKEDSVREVVAA